jgi:prepilin-type N-terminal cleavage/methylation domain-containing protein
VDKGVTVMLVKKPRCLSQSGLTLLELLAAVVLAGIIIVPLFSALGDSYERTANQDTEYRMLFYAEEIMDRIKVRDDLDSDETVDGIYFEKGQCTAQDGCVSSVFPDADRFVTYTVKVSESSYGGLDEFYDILVEVYPRPADGRSRPVRLLTVVRR